MDIERSNFPTEIVRIIQDVADSHFIAFDLEFSGVAGRRKPTNGRKLTLQELYDDVKAAAERYQVLQVGLTVVKEDIRRGCYVARPYNFNINPVPSLKDRYFGRVWSFHSGAVDFLLRNNFRFDLPYTHGTHYLSHKDEIEARSAWIEDDAKRADIPDMKVKEEDIPLIDHIRASIGRWQGLPKESQDIFLNIPSTRNDKLIPKALNRYQVRLTHQIVRSDYPKLKTVSMGDFVQITNPTEEQQASEKAIQEKIREREISKAIGFRWLVDAIIGNDITNMPDEYLLSACGNDTKLSTSEKQPKLLIEALQDKLRTRPRVLVGHNCFTDLVNFYRCFIGDLPDEVKKFQEKIHALFPLVVDTKHMASFGKKWSNTTLEDVEQELRTEVAPEIKVSPGFDRYQLHESHHEAGYDSHLTATIAIKLSARLEKDGKYLDAIKSQTVKPEAFGVAEDGEEYVTAPESPQHSESRGNNAMTIGSNVLSSTSKPTLSHIESDLASIYQNESHNTTASAEEEKRGPHRSSVVTERQKAKNWSTTEHGKKGKSDLKITNMYEVLSNNASTEEDHWDEDRSSDLISFSDDENSPKRTVAGKGLLDETDAQKHLADMVKKGKMMPRWDSDKEFWKFFGNKLQVNGCEERICYLS